MKILVFNCGSSSIKYKLLDMPGGDVLARGDVQRIGEDDANGSQQTDQGAIHRQVPIADHQEGLALAMRMLTDPAHGAVGSVNEIKACGHRVVHGGERFAASVRIDDDVETAIAETSDLAPLHNAPNLAGIHEARRIFGAVPQVACFDTAFHHSIPRHAYLYGLPYELYEKHRIRRYGFHGSSHRYVAARAAELLERPATETNLITCHLGNGCSIAAIRGGESVDTSMGFTPLEGVMMGSRAGSFDPAILFYLSRKGYSTDDLDTLANKHSGLLGISGRSNDVRDLEQAAAGLDQRAALALDMFAYSIRKTIGSYLAVLNGCHAVVFTGGIGENAPLMRQRILKDLDAVGVYLDPERNAEVCGCEGDIAVAEHPSRILVVPTNEELIIASETYQVITH